MKNITILGSTGSIGKTTLNIVYNNPENYRVVGLTCGKNWELLAKEVKKLSTPPLAVAVQDEKFLPDLREELKDLPTEVLAGDEGVRDVASLNRSNLVIVAIVGSAALLPTLSALKNRKDIALANKEALVIAGDIVMKEVKANRVNLIPVDSEHSALAQCLKNVYMDEVRRIVLTASGGPFWSYKEDMLKTITREEALAHPNWEMGDKITVDSATMMNKGFEVIEAHHLFDFPLNKISVFVHPQSIVHALVEMVDNSLLAQMAFPDMTLPVQYALTYPKREETNIKPINIKMIEKLEFHPPDYKRFPLLKLAYKCCKVGGSAPVILNSANDIAVNGFLDGRLNFLDIPAVIEETLGILPQQELETLEEILAVDYEARDIARGILIDYSKEG